MTITEREIAYWEDKVARWRVRLEEHLNAITPNIRNSDFQEWKSTLMVINEVVIFSEKSLEKAKEGQFG
jgi:hypothetical protein